VGLAYLLEQWIEAMVGNRSFVFRFGDIEVREQEFSLVRAGQVLTVSYECHYLVGTTCRESSMPPDQPISSSAMERLVTQEIGAKLTGILKENTPGRIRGLLTAKGRNHE